MFGFGKKPLEMPKPDQDKPLRFEANGNALYVKGQISPFPVIRDDGSRDSSELFESIAYGLNISGRYKFLRRKLQETVEAYDRGDLTAIDVKNAAVNMLRVIQEDEKHDNA